MRQSRHLTHGSLILKGVVNESASKTPVLYIKIRNPSYCNSTFIHLVQAITTNRGISTILTGIFSYKVGNESYLPSKKMSEPRAEIRCFNFSVLQACIQRTARTLFDYNAVYLCKGD